ncbi:MAG: hypothetical protein Q8M92_09180, partial [Candidatus Subteraquimicrobiales bacterium]|nr:hypothetical protein [Candidatus Subteraquimicrobiales bacterium]
MQENNPVPIPVVTPQIVVEQPKQNNFLVVLLSVLLLLSTSIAGFFAYQTQKLVKELTMLKTEEKVVAIATVEPTMEPVATDSASATSDPTANWKIYIDPKQRFSIKYPSSWRTISGDFFGTGPKEIGEDVLWGVNTFDINTNSMAKVVDDLGKQFSDRKQTTNKIKDGDLNASQIITTTSTIPDWYLETIVFEDADTIFTVSNGAIKDSNLQKMVGVPSGIM